MKWKPISTCPFNVFVIIYTNVHTYHVAIRDQFTDKFMIGQTFSDQKECVWEPTHWFPLPAQPVSQEIIDKSNKKLNSDYKMEGVFPNEISGKIG